MAHSPIVLNKTCPDVYVPKMYNKYTDAEENRNSSPVDLEDNAKNTTDSIKTKQRNYERRRTVILASQDLETWKKCDGQHCGTGHMIDGGVGSVVYFRSS